jgi:hypothetical protein
MGKPKPRSEDQNLHPDQWDDLNREFYRADPEAYFLRRLRYLILAIVDVPAVRDAQSGTIEFGKLSMPPEDPYDAADAAVYGAIESSNLLHHIAETVMRLYLAHEGRPDCPWLEVARLRMDLASRLESLQKSLGNRETIERILEVFRGHTTAAGMDPSGRITDEMWQDYTGGLVRLIDYLCTMLLTDGTMYNATKHGLGVVPSPGGFSLTSPVEGGFSAASQGPTVAYLKQSTQKGRRTIWTRVYDPVSVESNVALCQFLVSQLRGLWSVARNEYGCASEDNPGYVTNFPAWWVDHLENLGSEGQGVRIGQVTRNLAYLDMPVRPPQQQPPPEDEPPT